MRTKLILTALLFSVFFISGAQILSAQGKKNKREIVELLVPEMHCQNCQKKIEKNIAFEKGVTDLKVDLENKVVTVTYRIDKTTVEKLISAFKKIGYSAEIVPSDSI